MVTLAMLRRLAGGATSPSGIHRSVSGGCIVSLLDDACFTITNCAIIVEMCSSGTAVAFFVMFNAFHRCRIAENTCARVAVSRARSEAHDCISCGGFQ